MFQYRSALVVFLVTALISCQNKHESSYFPHDKSDLAAEQGIEYGRLPNGLRYAVMSNETPSNTASLLMRFDTGSVNEAEDERGLAHFLEHMAFNGSKNIPEDEMVKRLERFGLAFGADTNASTSFDETIYQLELPEVNDEIIDETLMIMRETASNLTLAPDSIERERGIILAEKRARSNPAYKAGIHSLEFFLDGSIYPSRIPIGTEEAIETVTPEQFKAFYEGYYRPENTFIVLVGDFKTDYAIGKIEEFFADWAAAGEAKQNIDIPVLGSRKLEAEYYVDPEIETSVSISVMNAPILRDDTAQSRRDGFIEGLGNRILSRRLAKIARSEEAVFISASSSSSNAYDIRSISTLSMSTQPENWEKALAQGEQALRQAYDYGFTQAELDEQIANTKKGLEVAVQTSPTRRTSSLARRIMGSFSSESVATDPAKNLERFEGYVGGITPEKVHAAFKDKWKNLDEVQLYLSTNQVIDNGEQALIEAFNASRKVAVEPLKAIEAKAFAYTEFGTPGKISKRDTVKDIEFETVIFDNNVRLNIKKTPYQKDVMSIRVAIGAGELFFPQDMPGFKWFAPNMLGLAGLKAHSADDIQTLMAGKSVGSSISFGPERMYITGATVPDNLSDQLNLMTAYATEPGYRSEAKTRYDKYIESFYPTLDSTPQGVAGRDVDRLIRSGDPRFGIPAQEDLVNIEMENLEAWLDPNLKESAIEIGIVGDVDIDTIISEVGRTFGALPKRLPNHIRSDASKRKLIFPKGTPRPVKLSHAGQSDTALLSIYWPAPDGTQSLRSRRVSMLTQLFQLRLTEVMREEEGASYSPSAFNFSPRTYPDYGYVGVSMELNPKDLDRISTKIDQIAQEFKAGEFDADLFERAIKPTLESIERSLESNGYWMSVIAEGQTDIERLDRHRSRAEAYKSMTVEDLKPLAKRIFTADHPYRVQILPEQ